MVVVLNTNLLATEQFLGGLQVLLKGTTVV